jgi:hydrogenase maturation protease
MSSVATTEPARGADPGTGWGAPAPAGVGPTFVVGIGNPILGDDGIGWRVVQEVERRWAPGPEVGPPAGPVPPPVVFLCVSLGGLSLMERLVGASRAILVDAVTTRNRPVGSILVLPLAELVPGVSGHLDNAHDASLPVALAVGRSLGAELPTEIVVVGIEARRVDEFGEELSPPVAAALPGAVEAVLDLLRQTVAGSP